MQKQQIWALLGPSTAVETIPQCEGEIIFHLLSIYERAAEASKCIRRKIQVHFVLLSNVDMWYLSEYINIPNVEVSNRNYEENRKNAYEFR